MESKALAISLLLLASIPVVAAAAQPRPDPRVLGAALVAEDGCRVTDWKTAIGRPRAVKRTAECKRWYTRAQPKLDHWIGVVAKLGCVSLDASSNLENRKEDPDWRIRCVLSDGRAVRVELWTPSGVGPSTFDGDGFDWRNPMLAFTIASRRD